MSTRSATIIRQVDIWPSSTGPDSEERNELLRFYRHCDGYPDGHGLEMAKTLQLMTSAYRTDWAAQLISYMALTGCIEIEGRRVEHGDLEYLYVVDGVADHRAGVSSRGAQITLSVYRIGWDEPYQECMKKAPYFTGTPDEYVERFGKEQ